MVQDTTKVALTRISVEEHNAESVDLIVRTTLNFLGGMERFVQPGQVVFIKPNQTLFFLSDEGVTTDPWVVAALVRLAFEAGASRVEVGDMPGAGITAKEVMSITGMDDAARKAGAEIVYLDEGEQVELAVPNGKVVDKITLPEPIASADVLINVPKAKTHFVDVISGALKNWMGAMRPDIRMRHHDVETPEYVVDCVSAKPPTLHVMDALIAGEGNGPGANTPKWIGCIAASIDPVATDIVTAQLLGFSPNDLTYAKVAASRGIGKFDPDNIQVLGVPLSAARTTVTPTVVDKEFTYLKPVRVIVGEGVSLPGTIGHFKSVADIWHKQGSWDLIRLARGTPTIMIGRSEDLDFDRHLEEGPYICIDDAADDKYKRHPKVKHIPGHPVCDEMMFRLIEALGVKLPAMTMMNLQKFWTNLQSEIKY